MLSSAAMSEMPSSVVCIHCAGSGWQTVELSGTVRRCSCLHAARIERLLTHARIPSRYEHCDLESYKPQTDEASQRRAKQDVSRFLEKYPLIDVGLLLLGPCGVGKTHLAISILKHIILEKGDRGLFYDFRDLLREIQGSWSPVSQASELEVLRPVLEADVLVLDELGAGKPSDWVRETVAYIINCRYNDKRLTIFTSNYPDASPGDGVDSVPERTTPLMREESLTDRIGVRLRSRLYEMCKVIKIEGKDFRQTIRQANYRF
jgi:DNA replication protein DnaC